MVNAVKRVAIIGAGASGLASVRQALDYGVEPVVFEMSNEVGGLWHYKPEETDESSVMKSTVINTSKEMTAFSDFPPTSESANFMHNRQMFQYLKDYANHFCLQKFIRFEHKVENISRSSDYKTSGTWTVKFRNSENEAKVEIFDGVLLCTGHHASPYIPPKWPGQNQFCGRISHAHSYKDHRGFEDKTIVVVGVGNSGMDVAVELSRIGKQVYLSTRRGTWVLNRNFDNSEPFDLVLNRRFIYLLFSIFPTSWCHSVVTSCVEKRLNHEKYGLKPKHNIFAAHWTVNDELSNRLSCGTIIVKPNIKSFNETNVLFDDGSIVEDVDEVILCTGYSFGFPLLENGNLVKVEENNMEIYKYMFPVETADHNTLALIGYIQPLGSIMPISEMQARIFFDVLMGGTNLPNIAKMRKDIKMKSIEMSKRYVKSRRHTIQVDYVTYMDELASLMGCLPNMGRLLFEDPRLAWNIFCGPNYPYVYRICGPKQWKGARSAIFDANKRKECGMRGISEMELEFQKNSSNCANKQCKFLAILSMFVGTILLFWLNLF